MKSILKILWAIVRVLFAVFMIYAGVQHFVKPQFYMPFVPVFLPMKMPIIYVSGIVEVVLGLALVIPKYAKKGALGLMILMLIFLPLHVWDAFSEIPVIGSQKVAMIRLIVQFLFIAIPWKLKNTSWKV